MADVPGIMSDIWQSPSTFNESSLEVLNVENSFKSHYKNRIVQEWSTFSPTQVKKYMFFLKIHICIYSLYMQIHYLFCNSVIPWLICHNPGSPLNLGSILVNYSS